jgi:hypothetical protein
MAIHYMKIPLPNVAVGTGVGEASGFEPVLRSEGDPVVRGVTDQAPGEGLGVPLFPVQTRARAVELHKRGRITKNCLPAYQYRAELQGLRYKLPDPSKRWA